MADYDTSHLAYHQSHIQSLYPACHVHTRQFDAADEAALEEVVRDALERYGRLDVFFANAGITGAQAVFTNVTREDYMETMRVNALG